MHPLTSHNLMASLSMKETPKAIGPCASSSGHNAGATSGRHLEEVHREALVQPADKPLPDVNVSQLLDDPSHHHGRLAHLRHATL